MPLLSYVYYYTTQTASTHAFGIASLLTSLAFIVVGWLKASVTQTSHLRAIVETLLLGGIAAALAYWVGDILEKIIQ
ncbi:MAG: VIT1/CCC1 transporter family protein [Bacteroidota bacterium]